MIHPNRSLHWLALSWLSVLLLPKPVSDAGAATPLTVIQEIRMIGMVPQLTITGEVGQTNWILYADEVAPQADWKVLTNVVVMQSPYVVVDANAAPALQRFYEVAVTGGADPSSPTNMVWIPPGTFTMGSPMNEVDRDSDEGPQTQVTISRGFWMGKYEVTQREYQALMGSNPSYFTGDLDRPVESVTWYDATNYCGKLTAWELPAGRLPAGYVYRLPTEAEWEYACRAGTTNATAFGNSLSSTQANFDGNNPYNGAAKGPYLQRTTKVGSYAPNAWGLCDVYGNVWEWCMDWYSGSLPGGSVTDPKGSGSGSYRAARGGGWSNSGRVCRSANRLNGKPDSRYRDMGFRVVLAPGP
jgi:formylglycine-generating enzyme required for sulfatase activity